MSSREGIELIERLRVLYAQGETKDIIDLAERACDLIPKDHRCLVDIAIIVRDVECFELSDSICRHILNRDPRYGFAHYELAVSRLLQGRHVDALLSLERIIVRDPSDVRSLKFAARMASRIGDHDRAFSMLQQIGEVNPDDPDLPWLRNLCCFIKRFPEEVALYKCAEREQDINRYLSCARVASLVQGALHARRGFSMIRLGDGEGAFCRISDDDEARYSDLYRRGREDRANVWFNGEIDLEKSGFMKIAFQLRGAIRSADLIGIPYTSWMKHEYKISSPTGMASLVNIMRMISLSVVDSNQYWTSQLCHMELHRSGLLASILRGERSIGLISSLPQAAESLKKHFSFNDVEYIPIPGEKLTVKNLKIAAQEGRHFPERFSEVMGILGRPLNGKLFLVAGGILGKFYCERIKENGGVALDIGSLVDAWMGLATRPGFSARADLIGGQS